MKSQSVFVLAIILVVSIVPLCEADPVGQWLFEEGPDGTTFLDSSGNGNHGTLSGDVFWSSSAPICESWSIYSTSPDFEAIVPDNGDILDITEDFTVAAWVKLVKILDLVAKHHDHGDYDGSWDAQVFRPYVIYEPDVLFGGDDYNDVVVQMGAFGSGGTYAYSEPRSAPIDSWMHIATTYDDANNIATFYINGEQAGVRTMNWQINDTVEPVTFGYLPNPNNPHGTIGDDRIGSVTIYKRALSAFEIEELVAVCEPTEPTCELIPEEIASMQVSHHGGGVVAYDANLYVWTGYTKFGPIHYNRTALVEIYNPDTDAWSSGADIPQLKSSPACFVLNGKIYTVGGETNPSGSFTNTVHRYDPDTDTWVQMNDFPTTICWAQSVVCNGKAYVFGGGLGYNSYSPALYEYDEASDSWLPKAFMLTGVSGPPAAVCFDNKIWVFGGEYQKSMITQEVQIYDPATDTWAHGDQMPWKVQNSQAIAYGDDIWLFARHVYDEGIGDWIENEYAYKFSPESGEWTICGFTFTPPIKPNYGSKLGLLDGYVYFTDIYESGSGSERAFKVGLPEPVITVEIDIKPGSCPNPLNVKSKGVLPVAILGTECFDVGMIDVASIRLAGVDPNRSSYEDVAAPVWDRQEECECTTEGPDGYTDLTLKFRTQDIVDALGEVVNGEEFLLTLTGELSDGTSIEGADCIRVIKKAKEPKGQKK